ncbi:MAG: class I SAM-dependent RNA methyltransferase [Alphaproteobacteria bacterium]|nr:class I SAM-dependent RNA methyltransferase [Alphaproteobacteria bacterium]
MADSLAVQIDALGPRGDGIADHAGTRFYVAGALPGETVRARPGQKRGEGFAAALEEVLEPAPDRAVPPCAHFGTCGGCAVQHMADGAYADWKRGLVVAALERAGLDGAPVTPLVRTAPDGRRRAEFAAFRPRAKGAPTFLGFHERGSNRVVDIAGCHILRPDLLALVPKLRDVLAGIVPPGARWDVHVTLADNGADILVGAGHAPGPDAAMELAMFAEREGIARVSWDGPDGVEPVALRETPVLEMSGIPVEPPPGVFLQASAEAEAVLAGLVRDAVEGARIADLYSGVGTFSLPLAAGGATVHAVDSEAGALGALARAAGNAGFGGQVTTDVRDLAKRPLAAGDLKHFGTVVFDPPRAGAAAQAAELALSAVPRVVAVSCNPATFARDAALLVGGGYALERVTPVDQFFWSGHVELVGVFARG